MHLFPIPLIYDFKYVLISAVNIYVASILINKAIIQLLNDARQEDGGSLTATAGALKGAVFSLSDQPLTIGRDPSVCNVVLPADTPGVSRRHCTLELRADGVYIIDHGSTSGTFLQSGARLQINTWTKITGAFYLGSQAVAFSLNN